MAKTKNESELRLIRVLNAPVKLVWDMWTKDEHVSKWWGPRGFTLTTKSKDIRVGGQWVYTMHGPDGVDYPNITTYYEVEKYVRLVYDHGANDKQEALFRVTATFKEVDGKTLLDLTFKLKTPEAAKDMAKFIKKAMGESTWDRFAEYLEFTQNKKEVFIINRSFHATRELLFAMWTTPKHLAQWSGPTGSSMQILKGDICEGSSMHYAMAHPTGSLLHGLIHYKTIQPPERLVYVQSFSDEKGNVVKPPFAPTWPDAMLTTVTFHDEGMGETRITLQWEVYGNATDAERQTFYSAKTGMTGGWAGSFDRLEELLNS